MNSIRVASICLVVAFVFAPRPAQAQSIAARVTALEAAVAKLQSGQVVESDFVGQYAAVVFALDLGADPKVQIETGRGTITLRDNHDVDFSASLAHCFLSQTAGTWGLGCDPAETGDFSGTGHWSIDIQGSLVIQDAGGNDIIDDPNFIGAGGRVIIGGGTLAKPSSAAPTEIYSLTMILIKLPPTPPPPVP